ncbi:MAG: amidohydrolase, partial [Firmicutes bacterium]|nr:amidohydrolase [Bacillota bacterium]
MGIDYIDEAKAIEEEVIAIRRRFHEYPELGNEEFETSKFIKEYLKGLGIELQPMPGTAVVGILRGAYPGKTVGFRADMDALPVQETTNLPFASKVPGKMHA